MNLISFLAETCNIFGNDTSANDTFLSIIGVVRTVVKVLQILVPIALILWGTIDIGKAVIAGDEKKMKEAQKPFVKRLIAAVIVFLVPFIVSIVMGYVGSDEWKACWNEANGKGISSKNGSVLNNTIDNSGNFTTGN